jgi:hypothetical protein
VAELADPLPEDSDEDDDDDVLAALSEVDPFDPLAVGSFASFPDVAVLEPLRLSVR